MSQRQAITKASALRYARSSRAVKKTILDELCAVTAWHRDHARKELRQALVPHQVKPGHDRPTDNSRSAGANVTRGDACCHARDLVKGLHSDANVGGIGRCSSWFCRDRSRQSSGTPLLHSRFRSLDKTEGAHVKLENWHIVRQTVGYHCYNTAAELELLN